MFTTPSVLLFIFNLTCFTVRPEMVVGWYHSHPGFGCWLSGVDINTQQSFEALSERAVAVVVDPIQSVKGKVKMCDCCKALHIFELFFFVSHTYKMIPGGLLSLLHYCC